MQLGTTAGGAPPNGATDLFPSSPDDVNSPEPDGDGDENCSSCRSKSDEVGLLDPQPVDRVSEFQAEANAVVALPSSHADSPVSPASPAREEQHGYDAGNEQCTASNLATSPPPNVRDVGGDGDDSKAVGSLQPAILNKSPTKNDHSMAAQTGSDSSRLGDPDDKAQITTEDDGRSQQGDGKEDAASINGHLTRHRDNHIDEEGDDAPTSPGKSDQSNIGDSGSVGKIEGNEVDGGVAVVSEKKGGPGGHRGTSEDALEGDRTTADDDEVGEAAARGICKDVEGPDHSSGKRSVAADGMDHGILRGGSEHAGIADIERSKDGTTQNPMESAGISGKNFTTGGNVDTGASADSATCSIESGQVHDEEPAVGRESPQEDQAADTVGDAGISTNSAATNEGVGSETWAADAGLTATGVYSQPAAKDMVDSLASAPHHADGRVSETLDKPGPLRGEQQRSDPAMRNDTGALTWDVDNQVDDAEAITLGGRVAACMQGKGDETVHLSVSSEGPERRVIDIPSDGNDTQGGSDGPETSDTASAHQRRASKSISADDKIGSAVEEPASVDSLQVWRFPCFFEASVLFLTAASDERDVECAVECGIEINDQLHPAATGDVEKSAVKQERCEAGESSYSVVPVDNLARAGGWRSAYCVYKFRGEHFLPPRKVDLEDDDAQDRLEHLLRQYNLNMEDVLGHFPVETDLTCGSAVIRAFTESIRHLQRSGSSSADGTGEDETLNATENIRTTVEGALRGPLEWAEMHATVKNGYVLKIKIINISEIGEAQAGT